MTRRRVALSLAALMLAGTAPAQTVKSQDQAGSSRDADRGRYVALNGIRMYFEDHGKGQAVLQIHGNDQSIASMSAQVVEISRHFRVIAADSRGHGKTELGPGPLCYEAMAEDFNALLEHLGLKAVYVLGWSDGGIVGLLLAMKHPDKVAKLAIMGASLNPAGAHAWAMDWAVSERERIMRRVGQGDTSEDWARALVLLELLMTQPRIEPASLERIVAPVLVMSGDADVIRLEHTLQIFGHLPRAQLAIFPGATHFAPAENPALFNATVLSFFQRDFRRPASKDHFR